MRLRKKPWIAEAIKKYEGILAEPYLGASWQEIFGRQAPLHVEIGTGRGRFITELAAKNPQVNFVGIEAQQDVIYYAAAKVADRQLSNIKLLCFNATGITEIFAPGEINRIYINFCDPWPKNSHAKRRLTHKRFLDKYRVLLASQGELFFKTDNERLFEFSLNQFADANLTLKNITFDLHNSDCADNIMTEYETKFSAAGKQIFRCEVVFD